MREKQGKIKSVHKSSNINEVIKAVLNFLFFFYEKILHALKAQEALKAPKAPKALKGTKTLKQKHKNANYTHQKQKKASKAPKCTKTHRQKHKTQISR